MGQWARTFMTIRAVIQNDGRIKFTELAERLCSEDARRFRSVKEIGYALERLVECVEIRGDYVVFNHDAGSYTKVGGFERSIQSALHQQPFDMSPWELYPLVTRENSDTCYVGIPWSEIPARSDGHDMCDFREDGEDYCETGCRVSREVLLKYNLIQEKPLDDFDDMPF